MTQDPPYHRTTIHEFKSNIARYIRALHDGRYRAVIVHRYGEPVGLFIPYKVPEDRGAPTYRTQQVPPPDLW